MNLKRFYSISGRSIACAVKKSKRNAVKAFGPDAVKNSDLAP